MSNPMPPNPPSDGPLDPAQLVGLVPFREVAVHRPELLKRAIGVRIRRLDVGDVLFFEGERGNTAFYIQSGTIELFVTPPSNLSTSFWARLLDRCNSFMERVWRVRARPSSLGSETLFSGEIPPQEVSSQEAGQRKWPRPELPHSWVALDSVRPFRYRRPATTLGPGSLFEELTCLNAFKERRVDLLGNKLPGTFPRPAAARAATAVVLLELDQPSLLALKEVGPLAAQLKESMKRVAVDASFGAGTPLTEEELKSLEIKGIKPFALHARSLAAQPGSVVRRQFKDGEIICRQGEFGSTAFIIEKGAVTVHLEKKASPVPVGFEPATPPKTIVVRSVDVPPGGSPFSSGVIQPVDEQHLASLGEGDLFGEMTCMNFYPRAATVKASADCVLLEILRSVLDMLKRAGPYKEKLDADYRERSLANHLRAVSLFKELPDEMIEELKGRAKLVHVSRFDKDQREIRESGEYTICSEGDVADRFFLVRSGTVKVTQKAPGGELILPYLVRGDYFGEVGLMHGGVCRTTCTALDHVELVAIDKEEFDSMLSRFPRVRERLAEAARRRTAAERAALQRYMESNLKEFVQQGLMDAQDLLIIDLKSCVRCDLCVRACAKTHGGVNRLVRDGARFDNYLITAACRSCRDPLCMIGCPVGAIRRRDSKEILIEDWCIGCDRCAEQCPHGAIRMHFFRTEEPGSGGDPRALVKKQAAGCDLCSGYVEPNCVYACPHGAARRVDPCKFFGSPAHRVAGRSGACP